MISLKEINNTKVITEFMDKLSSVLLGSSSSSLQQAKKNITSSEIYLKCFQKLLQDVENKDPGFVNKCTSSYINGDSKALFVVFGPSNSFCSSYNLKIIKYMNAQFNHYSNAKVFCIGDKILEYMNLHCKERIEKSYNFSKCSYKKDIYNQSIFLCQKIKKTLLYGKFNECILIYTTLKICSSNQIKSVKLIPVQINLTDNCKSPLNNSSDEFTYFNNKFNYLAREIINEYIHSIVFYVYSNSLACEHKARAIVTQSIKKNAENKKGELKLLYNRRRQSIITTELLEIVSAINLIN